MVEVKQGVYVNGEESFDFDFYTDLSAMNKLYFVNSVVDILVGDNYNSIIRDLIFDFYVIDVFTNVDLTDIKNSEKFVEDVEQLLYKTNIVGIVKENAKYGLIEELNNAVDKSIEYKTGIHKNPFSDLGDALAKLVNTLDKKLESVRVSDLEEMAKVFGGMTGNITPESIVSAYVNSDIFKNNVKEIEEEKKTIKKQNNKKSNLS